jgi:hypothetical protein
MKTVTIVFVMSEALMFVLYELDTFPVHLLMRFSVVVAVLYVAFGILRWSQT